MLFDSAGFETPIVETPDFQLGQISDARKAEEIIHEIARYSNVIIAVVGQLTFSEQQLLMKIKIRRYLWYIIFIILKQLIKYKIILITLYLSH